MKHYPVPFVCITCKMILTWFVWRTGFFRKWVHGRGWDSEVAWLLVAHRADFPSSSQASSQSRWDWTALQGSSESQHCCKTTIAMSSQAKNPIMELWLKHKHWVYLITNVLSSSSKSPITLISRNSTAMIWSLWTTFRSEETYFPQPYKISMSTSNHRGIS